MRCGRTASASSSARSWAPDALPATRRTLETIARLGVDVVIPGHGAAFDDFDGALARAFRRLDSFEADPTRVGRNAVRACFTFNLLDLQRLREDELPGLPEERALLPPRQCAHAGILRRRLRLLAAGRTLRSRSIELRDGWIYPTIAPPASPALWRRARQSLARSRGARPINWPCETPRSPLAAEGPPGRSLN
jgi:hypothetical protein